MCLTEFSKTTKRGPWKVAKNNGNIVPLLKMQQHESQGKVFKNK